MAFWRSFVDQRARFPETLGVPRFACLFAAILMVVGASYASAHDHDDHGAEFESECVVCSVLSSDSAKIAPEETTATEPIEPVAGLQTFNRIVAGDARDSRANPVRGPPLSVSS